ncbi:MAG: superoxide dismutase [Deltaproteobacteria bacterium]|nr:superoxide dismutase [Deltaproteobacteria bacterium]
MTFKLPELPFAMDSLAPFLTEDQVRVHYTKHHNAYFTKLNGQVEGKPEAEMALDDLVVKAEGGVFNNAAQAWNHTFFWNCLSPQGGGKPGGELLSAIERDFGSFDAFKEQFSNAAATLFGSGWAWLVKNGDKLEILALSNADTPLKHGKTAVLTIDVWEHAYYIDYRNERPRFIAGFWNAVNWDFAAESFAK